MGTYTIAVVGESFRNADGSSRQREIGRCHEGEPVTLAREPDNPHDANCIRVISRRGVQIGNIGRDDAEWMAERIDKGRPVAAAIKGINEGGRGLAGVVLLVSTDEEGLPAAPRSWLSRLFG